MHLYSFTSTEILYLFMYFNFHFLYDQDKVH